MGFENWLKQFTSIPITEIVSEYAVVLVDNSAFGLNCDFLDYGRCKLDDVRSSRQSLTKENDALTLQIESLAKQPNVYTIKGIIKERLVLVEILERRIESLEKRITAPIDRNSRNQLKKLISSYRRYLDKNDELLAELQEHRGIAQGMIFSIPGVSEVDSHLVRTAITHYRKQPDAPITIFTRDQHLIEILVKHLTRMSSNVGEKFSRKVHTHYLPRESVETATRVEPLIYLRSGLRSRRR